MAVRLDLEAIRDGHLADVAKPVSFAVVAAAKAGGALVVDQLFGCVDPEERAGGSLPIRDLM
jgi:hypothetical protein